MVVARYLTLAHAEGVVLAPAVEGLQVHEAVDVGGRHRRAELGLEALRSTQSTHVSTAKTTRKLADTAQQEQQLTLVRLRRGQ